YSHAAFVPQGEQLDCFAIYSISESAYSLLIKRRMLSV
ncbi:MAG: hypothetical protein RL640_819, partial [Bacteroidota bacterium]